MSEPTFALGTLVRKKGKADWRGTVVGHYSTDLTPSGSVVESLFHPGTVQLYPDTALGLLPASERHHLPSVNHGLEMARICNNHLMPGDGTIADAILALRPKLSDAETLVDGTIGRLRLNAKNEANDAELRAWSDDLAHDLENALRWMRG